MLQQENDYCEINENLIDGLQILARIIVREINRQEKELRLNLENDNIVENNYL